LLEYGKKPLKKKNEKGGEKEKMNAKYKKSLKFVTLLMTALLIATVSAEIYNYMYINGTGTITTTGLRWGIGPDAPAGTTVTGPTVTVALTTNEGNPRNYTQCLNVTNLDAALTHSFNITVSSSTGDVAEFTEFNLVLFDASNNEVAVLNLLSQGSSATLLTIGTSEVWPILFELIPVASPTPDASVTFTVTLVYV
jgi:hypothetical protein